MIARTIGITTLLLAAVACQRGSGGEAGRDEVRPGVAHLRIEGVLDVGSLGLLERAVRESRGKNERLIIEIDTPGGRIDLMWLFARAIDEASRDLLTVAWINTHAISAGSLVAMACDRIYMRPSGTIGSALPVRVGVEGMAPVSEFPDEKEKELSALRSEFRSWAEAHGRPPELAEAMVDPGVSVRQVRIDGELRFFSGVAWDDALEKGDAPELVRTIVEQGQLLNLTGAEALELGFIDGIADTLQDVLEKTGGADVQVMLVERSRSEDLAAFLDQFRMLFLIIGIVAAYVELKIPGFGIPGIVSIASFALVLLGQYLVGLADFSHIVAVALGLVLVAVEIFVMPGTIWVGALGAVLVLGGILFASLPPGLGFEYALDRRIAIDAAFRTSVAFAGALVLGGFLSRVLPKTPILNRLVLAGGKASMTGSAMAGTDEAASTARTGALGRAITDLRPVGKVALEGHPEEEYEARAAGAALDAGTTVRVVEVHAGRLVVEEAR